jgi:hypothetical protein
MAEQTFRSPGFFEQEIDLSARQIAPVGTPAGVIGTSEFGPAFVPVTVGSFADFESRFGTLHPDRFGPYAVREFLKHRSALTYLRVLGAGANETSTDIQNTEQYGYVKNAGFRLTGSLMTDTDGEGADDLAFQGGVAIISAKHTPVAHEAASYSLYTDNASISNNTDAHLVRGVVFLTTGSKLQILDHDQNWSIVNSRAAGAEVGAIGGLSDQKYFKLAISSSAGASFSNDEGVPGIRILTASLDPNDGQYIGKVLNTNPQNFQKEQHLLYLDYAVEHELAPVTVTPGTDTVAVLSGTINTSTRNSLRYDNIVGRYDTRYTTPRTTSFISQPFGKKEFDLFHFETISDGAYANDKFKVSIANLRASTDPNDAYGTFEVQVRLFDDKDTSTEIIERYPECSLNPRSDRYVARVIGDKKVRYDFDQEDPSERRLVITGKYPNLSSRIRIQMNAGIEAGEVPATALPFGFRGIPVLKTNNSLTDGLTGLTDSESRALGETVPDNRKTHRLNSNTDAVALTRAIVPPMPYRFKVTRGEASSDSTPGFVGTPGTNERVDGRYYWGVNSLRIPTAGSTTNPVLNSNAGNTVNPLVRAYTKFQGIEKLDALVSGSAADEFNSNKFTLARVAFSNKTANNSLYDVFSAFTGSAPEHMLEAAYIRDGQPDRNTYVVDDRVAAGNRFTLASLIHTSSVLFNRFTSYAKFTNVFHGGFDGLNILDRDLSLFRDKAFSVDAGGKSVETGMNIGLADVDSKNQGGSGRRSNSNASMRRAVDIMTDPMSSNINILAIPGVRETFVSDHALEKTRDYSKAMYLLDTLKYDENGNRLYDDSKARVDVRETSEQFESRAIDNNYAATYFPDVFIQDPINNRNVKVPASVAALGTLAFNDRVSFPWFAPAGFNRGGMDFVVNVENRLTSGDRDTLYDARMNPIAVFPNTGFVIFGQKTLQFTKSALDRVNVRRLMLEIKRQVTGVAERFLFEPNNATTRSRFVSQITPLLGLIQLQAGIEQFKVICDASNNTSEEVEQNRMNGRIVVVPTRAVEFISIDFIITNSGVSFE